MKRLMIFLLSTVMILSSLCFAVPAAETELAAEAAKTTLTDVGATADEVAPTGFDIPGESQFQSKLSSLRSKYPNGSIWEGVYYEYGSPKAWTCFAYAVQMMHEIFGVNYYEERIYSYIDYSFSGICAGDIVRIDGDSHSIFIIKVTDSGFYYTDGNGTGIYNQVRWDGYYSYSEMQSRFTYKVHLPGNNLTGIGLAHTIAYNANGGKGSLSSHNVAPGDRFKLQSDGFTRSGYSFAGYTVKRSYDNTWYTTDAGWQPQSEIIDNGYHYKIYPQGNTYPMSAAWLGDITAPTTFTFYAQWLPDKSTVEFMSNYSGYNYILGSDLGADYSDFIFARDSSAYSVSVDSRERLNNANSLKIVGSRAGSKDADLAIATSTNKGYGNGYSVAGEVGDEQKSFTMRFYAKASVDGAKMYLRWAYGSQFYSISLTKDWKLYSVTMPKTNYHGPTIHPYFDKAGTYYLNSLTMSDIAYTSNVVPETGYRAAASQSVTRGGTISKLPAPERAGYTFAGWYTAAEGGQRVTESTPITKSTIRLYAHWNKNVSDTPVKTVKYNDHFYELYDNALSWEDAAAFCRKMGGHLITIGDEAENKAAYDMISDRQGFCWIGLHYLKNLKTWEWVDDTTDLNTYQNWYNPSFGTNDSGEYYALLYPMNYNNKNFASTWDKCKGSSDFCAYYGYRNSFFICEYDDPMYLGDIDGNSKIDIDDVILIQRATAGLPTGFTEEDFRRGDIDGSGEVDIIDATLIQYYLAELQTPYAIGEWFKN